jgi:predicted ATPase/signal transduction histidine kinase
MKPPVNAVPHLTLTRELRALTHAETLEFVHHGREHALYRAPHRDGGAPILVKATDTRAPTARSLAMLRGEYEIMRELDVPGVAKATGLLRVGKGLALVMDDAGPRTLAERLARQRLDLPEMLDVAVELAETVARLQERHCVHRNLTPENVLWNPESRRTTLIAFGKATTIAAVTNDRATADEFQSEDENALKYLSPEQTGRTNQPTDYRTDHYALGTIFYEMLVGEPPFNDADRLSLIHAHAARRPVPPHERAPGIPSLLSELVLKLLAKAPEERYQAAEALASDLREIRSGLSKQGGLVPFRLGRHDVAPVLEIPDKLYGRARELELLRAVSTRVAGGARELLTVRGTPGVGKTALTRHLEPLVLQHGGFFVTGKFDQLARSVPYSALVQALGQLARRLLAEPEAILAHWRTRIQSAVSPNGQLLADVIPELVHVLGPQPAVTSLGPVESKNRFGLTFEAFVRVFTGRAHPLAIFLDDVQWIDASSLELIERLVSDTTCRHLLVVLAYRDSEVTAAHTVALAIAALRKTGATVSELEVAPLDEAQATQLTADTLRCDADTARPLARMLVQKTVGNPFFLKQMLRSLYSEGLIRFGADVHHWQWDLRAIEAASITDNVVEHMIRAIDRLPSGTRQLLRQIACLGSRVDAPTLAAITGMTPHVLEGHLWPAVERGLLVQLADRDRPANAASATLQFVHDRVQQAAYMLVPERDRPALHAQLGRRLLANGFEEQLPGKLFDIVDQLNRGEAVLIDRSERRRCAELNLQAGRRAKSSAAYDAAFEYVTFGGRFLPDDRWLSCRDLAFPLLVERAEAAYLTGRHAAAEAMIDEALEHAPSLVAKVDLYSLRALAATVAGDYARALEWGRQGLAVFGLEWPLVGLDAATEVEAAAVMKNVGERRLEDLANEPEVEDPETRACMRLLSILGPPAYFGGSEVLTFLVTRSANLSLLHGPSHYTAYAYVFYGALHNARTGEYDVGYAFGNLALALARRFGNRAEESRTLEVFGLVVQPWKAPVHESPALMRQGFRAGVESGELAYAAFNLSGILINSLAAGVPLADLLADAEVAIEFATRNENRTAAEIDLPFRQFARTLMAAAPASSFDDEDFLEARFLEEAKGNQTALGQYWVARLQASYLFGDYETARRSSEESAKRIQAGILGMVTSAEYAFYAALTLAASAEVGQAPTAELEELSSKLSTWAEHCPENFRHKERLVLAERARLAGEPWRAMQLYRQAIEGAAREGFIQDEALANELRGRFLLEQDEPQFAAVSLRAARTGFERWGANAKVRALDDAYAELSRANDARFGTGVQLLPTRDVAVDALGLIRASQAISAEIVPDRLFERILRIVVEIAGAQKAALLLINDGELVVRARATARMSLEVSMDDTPFTVARDLPGPILRYAMRVREPLVLADAMSEGQFSSDPEVRELGIRSVLIVPIHSHGDTVGLLYLENASMRAAFPEARVEIVRTLGAQAAISIENSTLLSDRQRSESVARFLADAATALSQSLDYSASLRRLAKLAVPVLGDICIADVVEPDGGARRIAVAHAAAEHELLAAQIERHSPRIERHPLLLEHASEARMRAITGLLEPELPSTSIASCSIISVPLMVRQRVFGALTLLALTERRRHRRSDLAIAEELAQRAALAIDNALHYQEARDAIRLRDEFLTVASHELRTPLTTLGLQADGLLRDTRAATGSDRVFYRAQKIRSQATRLEELVDGMLDVDAFATDKLSLRTEDVDLMVVVQEVIARSRAESERANAPIQVRGESVLGRWDRARLERLLVCLTSNAIKFGRNEPIDVVVGPTPKGAHVVVRDRGVGIAPEDQDRIFARFERATSARHFGGLGLGLWVARQLAAAMKGTIRVESQPGAGAAFTVELPRQP